MTEKKKYEKPNVYSPILNPVSEGYTHRYLQCPKCSRNFKTSLPAKRAWTGAKCPFCDIELSVTKTIQPE